MLYEYKEVYLKKARDYPDWDKLDKNELCRKYKEFEATNSVYTQACLSAIIYRFWYLPMNFFYKQQVVLAQEDDCYNWLITSINYCLKATAWNDSSSTVYKNPKGPEIVISRCFDDEMRNFFKGIKRQKRYYDYYDKYSLEALQENSSDSYYMPVYDRDTIKKSFLDEKVLSYYKSKEYLKAFLLDTMIEFNFYLDAKQDENTGKVSYEFNCKRLKSYIRKLDDKYCKLFSSKYLIDYDDVKKSSEYVKNLSYDRLNKNVDLFFNTLKNDSSFKEELMC